MKSHWREKADLLPKEAQRLGPLAVLLQATLMRSNPQYLASLGEDLYPFLRVQQAEMKSEIEQLVNSGTDPETARQQVIADFLENLQPVEPADDSAEVEANSEAVVLAWLASLEKIPR